MIFLDASSPFAWVDYLEWYPDIQVAEDLGWSEYDRHGWTLTPPIY